MKSKTLWSMVVLVFSLFVGAEDVASAAEAKTEASENKKEIESTEVKSESSENQKAIESFEITAQTLGKLQEKGLPADVLTKLEALKNQKYMGKEALLKALEKTIGKDQTDQQKALIFEAAYYYEPNERREPFKPQAQGTPTPELTPLPGEHCEPPSPLEKFELKELRVKGIILGGLGDHARVLAPDGKSYNLTVGTCLGKFQGKVTVITENVVLIKETRRYQKGAEVITEEPETRLYLNPLEQDRAP